MDIKIVTINTWKCDGEYHRRMSLLSAGLKKIDPQIIACQECFFSEEGNADTAGWLAGELGMYYSFVGCRPKKRYFSGRWVDSLSGMAVLSRFPFIRSEPFELSGVPEDEGRKVQQVELEILPGKKIGITNVHLTHLRDAIALRERQVIEVCERLESGDQAFSIVCGDFNAGLRSAGLSLLKDRSGAADAYILGGGREPRISLVESFQQGVARCVDHIFCIPLRGGKSYPLFKDAAVVLNEADAETGLYPSDHFGIGTVLVADHHHSSSI